jgi:hypothetical protein
MLHALIDRQDGQVTGTRQPAGIEDLLKVSQRARSAITGCYHAVDEIRPGQMQCAFGESATDVFEQICGLAAKVRGNIRHAASRIFSMNAVIAWLVNPISLFVYSKCKAD